MVAKIEAEILQRLAEANDRLKQAGVGLAIQPSGSRLRLRGHLPDEDGKMRRRYISQGTRFSLVGVREAERLAHRVRDDIATGKFDLREWRSRKEAEVGRCTTTWIAEFEQDYFARRRRSEKSELTYRTEYAAMFRRLPRDVELTEELMRSIILSTTEPDSRSRQRACLCFGRLAAFAGIDSNFKPLRGAYRFGAVDARSLPTKKSIIEQLEAIPSERWRAVAQRQYVYGLRNHEGFRLRGFNGVALVVGAGKTGSREVLPCDRGLVERWGLMVIRLPECSGSHDALGHRVSTQFRRYRLPFRPYDLRQ